MKMPRALVRRVLHPLHERLRRRNTHWHFVRMRAHDRLDAERLQGLHDGLLMEHLRRSRATVPFYREFVEGPLDGLDDLRRFPVLDKARIREAGRELIADGWRGRVFALETGGSSGEPLRFYTDRFRESSQLACKLRARAWWGLHAGHRETDFWGSPIETSKGSRLRQIVADALGFQLLSAFALNDETMGAFDAALGDGRCDFVYGYPSVLARYARFTRAQGIDLKTHGIKLVICTAEVLLPPDREEIEAAFGCSVANEYGCRDGGLIAHECPEGGFHLMHDAVHVELLDESGAPVPFGEEGEVVLTNLHAKGSPLIRYRLGDRARFATAPCPCGLPHPRLEQVAGRITDSLVRPDGTRVHGLALIYVLREFPGVAQFRCRQRTRTTLDIDVVPAIGFEARDVEEGIIARVQQILGADIQVKVELRDQLEALASGKHRFIICEV